MNLISLTSAMVLSEELETVKKFVFELLNIIFFQLDYYLMTIFQKIFVTMTYIDLNNELLE